MIKIRGGAQSYAWGKQGTDSLVSQFIQQTQNIPYAQYWLGTHPNLPSTLQDTSSLQSLTGSLQYLFKILSISQPLSIQVHPNKSQAQILHQSRPQIYPDSNHKPQLCIALTPMKLLYGFHPLQKLVQIETEIPELAQITSNFHSIPQKLQALFENQEFSIQAVTNYIHRIQEGNSIQMKLHTYFPYDIGIFFSLFMQLIELRPGQGIFIHPGYPHCYLEGDCIQAMAASDNVVRAGLTPKLKDVQTLLNIVDYQCVQPPEILIPVQERPGVFGYRSQYEEFKVKMVQAESPVLVEEQSLGFVLEGEVDGLSKGSCFLIEKTCEIRPKKGSIIYLCSENRLEWRFKQDTNQKRDVLL